MGIGWSLHKNDGWLGQLSRIRRWHSRLVTVVKDGSSHSDVEDFIYTFFQNCYYLREWLEKTSNISKSVIDDFYSQTIELRLCRDICNSTKHYSISRASVDGNLSIGREYNPNEQSRQHLVLLADEKYDLLDLASKCVKLLDEFVQKEGA